jgi:FkbM family methyltransferase
MYAAGGRVQRPTHARESPLIERSLTLLLKAEVTGRSTAVRRVRKLITSTGLDPIVPYRIGDVWVRLPLTHDLPRIRARYPIYGTNQASVAASMLKKYSDLSAIDIGANIGDTVAFWRGVGNFPVLAVEPSELYLRLLRLNASALGDVTVHAGLIGESDAEEELRIEERRGTARAVKGGTPQTVMRLTTLIATYPAFQNAKLLKIDTDGSDGEIILGGCEWIAAAKPAVFFEFSPVLAAAGRQPLLEAVDALLSIGYGPLLFYDNAGEFALMVDASERDRIEELHAHALAWGEERYWDIAAFHSEDEDAAMKLRSRELSRSPR